MSEMSERFYKYAKDPNGVLKKIMEIGFDKAAEQYPGLPDQVIQSRRYTELMISSGVRWFQGKAPWESAEQALMDTGMYLKDRSAAYLQACLGKGYTVGQHFDQFAGLSREEVQEKLCEEEFTNEAARWCETIFSGDEDLAEKISEMIVGALHRFIEHSGLRHVSGRDLNHVWSAWNHVLSGSGSAFFVYGVEMGKEDQLDHQFNELAAMIGSLDS